MRNTREQVFSSMERLQRRALQLVHGGELPSEDEPLAERVELRLPRLPQLMGELDLPPLATDLLLCLLLAEYEPFSRTLIRALQREGGRPWLELGTVAELLELPREAIPELGDLCAPDGVLCRWLLIEREEPSEVDAPLMALRVKIPGTVARFLLGEDRLPQGVWLRAPESQPAREVAPALVTRLRRALLQREPLFVEIVGQAHTGRLATACAIADHLGRALLTSDLAGLEGRTLERRLTEARREARLHDALLCLRNFDRPGPAAGEEKPRELPQGVARFFESETGLVLTTSQEPQALLGLQAVIQVTVPFPSPSERARLLETALTERGLRTSDDIDLATVTRRFALDPQRIVGAAHAVAELARLRDPDTATVSHGELVEACRRQTRHDLKSLATRVDNSHRWEDLVIPVDVYESLVEIISYVRHAKRVYDEWGFAARHSLTEGVSALFAGPPGTGKTMCASVVARELDMELFRVDLSRVVSKWIGETEKNLGKVFDEAQRSNAVILFDEADSLFAKRTEVKSSVDRYANLEVNYLLQRMENFGGVTILTTNFEDTLDTAFKRRLTFRMRFEKPDAEARAALWRKVFPTSALLAPDVDADVLGRLYELSGGNIRNAAVRAAFSAAAAGGRIDQATCMRAAEREGREMGLLLRSASRDVVRPVEDPEEGPLPRIAAKGGGLVRPVPVTHPRR